MKKLSEFIKILNPLQVIHYKDLPVSGIQYLPDTLTQGDIFCCINEFLQYAQWVEGRTLLNKIPQKEVAALVLDSPAEIPVPQIIVKNTVQAMAIAAKYLYASPDEHLKLIGVTGTNGKTTITHGIRHLLANSFSVPKAACMGTVGVYVNHQKKWDSVYTTPLSVDIFKTMNALVSDNVNALAMEVSSHSLKLDRVYGLQFDAAVFSNLTRDHLDFHITLEDYIASKEKLFTMTKPNGVAVINIDDHYGEYFAKQANGRVIRYGFSPDADLTVKDVTYYPNKTEMTILFNGHSMQVTTQLVGRFNVSNLLACIGACVGLGADIYDLKQGIMSFQSVGGRMEIVKLPGNRTGIVDYAHTPDALEKILETIRETAKHRIITLFGCGGDRDRGKRPLMGEVASRLSDICIVTSDNPRTEEPMAIIQEILQGMNNSDPIIEPDRRKAIQKAFEISKENDIILIAGKGHETYQIIGTEKFHFSDQEELLKLNNCL